MVLARRHQTTKGGIVKYKNNVTKEDYQELEQTVILHSQYRIVNLLNVITAVGD